MLQSAELIIQYTAEYSKDDFIENIQLQDSVIRRLLVIAEVETKHETQHSASKQIKIRYNNLTLVMIATGNNCQIIIINRINKTISFINATRPKT